MEDIDSSPPSPNPRKRAAPDETSPLRNPLNLKGTQFMVPTPPDTDQSSNANPEYCEHNAAREPSPVHSNSTLTSFDAVSNPDQSHSAITENDGAPVSSEAPPAKRRKLTAAEKEQQRQEKETRAAERAEQKAKKEDERRVKDEEKRRKAEERDSRKREKEIEEEKKVAEKMKKERSQMRLGAFFGASRTPAKAPLDFTPGSVGRAISSPEPLDAVDDRMRQSESPCKPKLAPVREPMLPVKHAVSDYKKHFLPFELQSHCSLACERPGLAADEENAIQESFDSEIYSPSFREGFDLGRVDNRAIIHRHFSSEEHSIRGLAFPNLRQLVERIQGSSQIPIDLTQDDRLENPMDAFQLLPRRHIQFQEDVRPAYFGSYTKIKSRRSCGKLRRNPFRRLRPDTDYDYDSECEWQEEEEGEDLDVEDDDEADSVGDAGEMDGFLDDEDDTLKSKRKVISGDLIPSCTGLCWENASGKIQPSDHENDPAKDMCGMSVGFLLPGFMGGPIDPFSTKYWEKEPAHASRPDQPGAKESPLALPSKQMAPPRPPLQPRLSGNGSFSNGLIGAAEGMKGPITSVSGEHKVKRGPKPLPKVLAKEDMDEFKGAVVGSPLGKADLLKGLKSRFPKLTNEAIKCTLGEHFAQVGASKADKKWIFVSNP